MIDRCNTMLGRATRVWQTELMGHDLTDETGQIPIFRAGILNCRVGNRTKEKLVNGFHPLGVKRAKSTNGVGLKPEAFAVGDQHAECSLVGRRIDGARSVLRHPKDPQPEIGVLKSKRYCLERKASALGFCSADRDSLEIPDGDS